MESNMSHGENSSIISELPSSHCLLSFIRDGKLWPSCMVGNPQRLSPYIPFPMLILFSFFLATSLSSTFPASFCSHSPTTYPLFSTIIIIIWFISQLSPQWEPSASHQFSPSCVVFGWVNRAILSWAVGNIQGDFTFPCTPSSHFPFSSPHRTPSCHPSFSAHFFLSHLLTNQFFLLPHLQLY